MSREIEVHWPYLDTTVTIPSTTTSAAIKAAGWRFCTIELPATVTSTYFTIEVSVDGTNFAALNDEDNNAIRLPSGGVLTDGEAYTIPPRALEGVHSFRLVGDATETADRTIKVGRS